MGTGGKGVIDLPPDMVAWIDAHESAVAVSLCRDRKIQDFNQLALWVRRSPVVEWHGDHGLDGCIDEEAMMARTAHAVDWAQSSRGIAE